MKKIIITIGRQFGSGGRALGRRLAKELQIGYYDKELLVEAAKESGLSPEFLTQYDEASTNSFLYSIAMNPSNMLFGENGGMSVVQMAAKAQREAVLNVAERGSCVIVGRCADDILHNEENLLSIFVTADEEDRIKRVVRRDKITEKEAKAQMIKMDKKRKSHYTFNTGREWGAAENYGLCLNMSRISMDKAVAMIKEAIS